MVRVLIINGPNLNLLGKREPSLYGKRSFEDYLVELKARFYEIELDYYQSNHEGDIIDKIQEADGIYYGIILNPGAYAHTSIAIADAIRSVDIPVIEVHITKLSEREPYRHNSYTAEACITSIDGCGLESYALGLNYLLERN